MIIWLLTLLVRWLDLVNTLYIVIFYYSTSICILVLLHDIINISMGSACVHPGRRHRHPWAQSAYTRRSTHEHYGVARPSVCVLCPDVARTYQQMEPTTTYSALWSTTSSHTLQLTPLPHHTRSLTQSHHSLNEWKLFLPTDAQPGWHHPTPYEHIIRSYECTPSVSIQL